MSLRHDHSTKDAVEEGGPHDAASLAKEPGAVLIYDGQEPACRAIPLGETALELGRGCAALGAREDPAMSRRHARLSYRQGSFHITDLGGKNGCALDGRPFHGELVATSQRILRLGHSLLLLCPDVRPYRTLGVRVDGQRTEGPGLQQVMRQVAGLAMFSRTLLILGESGTGKESLARAFHAHGPKPGGPFLAVNCATIPEGVAERLLLGAQKGAYSGAAADSPGYLVEASGGTLFLDEIAELDAAVQAKLLRVLETGEVTPLGATRARRIELRTCCATHKPLRELVAQGKFRADLFFRLAAPHVELPPLRRRLEEIPWYVCHTVRELDATLRAQASLIESCLLRAWPGNVRELLHAVRTASLMARLADCTTVGPQHLDAQAGAELRTTPERTTPPAPAVTPAVRAPPDGADVDSGEDTAARKSADPEPGFTRAEVMAAIVSAEGNVSAAARELGLQRTQLRRLLARYQIDIQKLRELT